MDSDDVLGVVYVIDDDDAVRDSLQWLLEASRYRVIGFDSAEKFLAGHDPEAIAVAIIDVRMPGMSGLELQDELIARKVPLPDHLHHRPWRRADGGFDDEEGRRGLHREAL